VGNVVPPDPLLEGGLHPPFDAKFGASKEFEEFTECENSGSTHKQSWREYEFEEFTE
jgi:hypothetical protein